MNSSCPVHSNLLQNTLGDYPFEKFFCQCVGTPKSVQTIEQRGDTGNTIGAHFPLNPPSPSSLTHSTVSRRVIPTKNRWECHICLESFIRWQERDRHQLTHLPYFIHCPLPHCAWKGNRSELFKKHWQKENHCSYHERYGRIPERSQIETYDPWEILNQMTNGTISPSEGEAQAICLVQVKAYELEKTDIWTGQWGRNRDRSGKQASSCR